jgi:hypothetical protein
MGLLSRLKGGPTIRELAKDAMNLGAEAITDKDKFNELQYKLAMIQAQAMLTGPGQSITKITICLLVSLVVGSGTWVFLFHPENLEYFKTYAMTVIPIIGMLTGSYVTGTSFKRSKWSNGNEKDKGNIS